ncbi:hypothetical protein F4780DRAFT_578803 [Xylariomycetidae sp. FL0641]|nr:hypothetical protein F4780DRAFT_578803 [Xylariomycetidae sp. FL0641]
MSWSPAGVVLSPALPSELLAYILNSHAYPTTLIICSSKEDFQASLIDDIQSTTSLASTQENEQQQPPQHALLRSPLHQLATSRHIRVLYIPTVTHLRASLTVFSASDSSKVPAAPAPAPAPAPTRAPAPALVVYGFLDLHRDTSEWSVQGLGHSGAVLVELARRLGWRLTQIEPRREGGGGDLATGRRRQHRLEDVLREAVPVLSGGTRRPAAGPDSEDGAWSGRTVEVGRILRRWFRFQRGRWDMATFEEERHAEADLGVP